MKNIVQLCEAVVLPDELVGPVVLVGDGGGAPGNGGDVPVVVVGVGVRRVASVLVGGKQGRGQQSNNHLDIQIRRCLHLLIPLKWLSSLLLNP